MNAFTVTVRLPGKRPMTYAAIGTDSVAVHIEALDRHGPCGVTVVASPRR